MPVSPRHATALAFAEDGIPVFPVKEDKTPATSHGHLDASTDIEWINRRWAEADYNVGFCPGDAGWTVVDLDVHEGKDNGLDRWDALESAGVETYTVRTPSGGRHLYFQGTLPRNSAGKLAPGIDTRSIGGYVLAPPSVTAKGAYTVITDVEMAPLPEWIKKHPYFSGGKEKPAEIAHTVVADDPFMIHRAREYLARKIKEPILEGGRNSTAIAIAYQLRDFGMTSSICEQLLNEAWAPACVPPFEEEEVERVVASAYRKDTPFGLEAIAPTAEIFAGYLKTLSPVLTPVPPSRFQAMTVGEMATLPDPRWLIPQIITEYSLGLLAGVTQSFKSYFALDLGLSIATGTTTFAGAPVSGGLVFYAASEGRHSLGKSRYQAWKLARGLDKDPTNFFLMPAPVFKREKDMVDFHEEIVRVAAGRPIALVIIDTASNAMAGWNENDPSDVALFVSIAKAFQASLRCALLVVHHESHKPGASRGPRGASNWLADFDHVHLVKPHHDEDGKPISTAVMFKTVKHKDAELPKAPWYLFGHALAGNLAFQPITEDEYKKIVKNKPAAMEEDETIERKRVANELKILGAVSLGTAVSTQVLASVLAPKNENDTQATIDMHQKKTQRKLNAAAGLELQTYCAKSGRDFLWFLPHQD